MKEKLWIILVLSVLLALFCCGSACAESSGKCGDYVYWKLDEENGKLTLTGAGATWDYPDTFPGYYSERGSIQEIYVKEGITRLGDYLFYNMEALRHIELPETLTDIGEHAVSYCAGLTGVVLPYHLAKIGSHAFFHCTCLSEANLPPFVSVVGANAFQGCTNLKTVTVRAFSLYIGEDAYKDCNVRFFMSGWNGSDAESYAESNGIHFTCLDTSGQAGTDVYWSFDPTDGTLSFSGTGNMWGYANKDPGYAFLKDCVRAIDIGSGVTSAGRRAFLDCEHAESLTVSDSLVSIGEYAFSNCKALCSPLQFSTGLETIGRNAFENCQGLTEVSLPGNMESLGLYAFRDCTGLESVHLNGSIQTVGDYAFSGCLNLSDLYMGKNLKQIGKHMFEDCGNLTSLTVGEGVETIGEYAFYNCTGLESVTFPGTLSEIGNYAFRYCTGLSFLDIPGSVKTIGDYAFSGCFSVDGLVIRDGVQKIGYCAFEDCSSLTGVIIPESVKNATVFCFSGIDRMVVLDMHSPTLTMSRDGIHSAPYNPDRYVDQLPSGLKTIGSEAFSGTYLYTVVIPDGVKTIASGTFSNCPYMLWIRIPPSVTDIAPDAFDGTDVVIVAEYGSAAQKYATARPDLYYAAE